MISETPIDYWSHPADQLLAELPFQTGLQTPWTMPSYVRIDSIWVGSPSSMKSPILELKLQTTKQRIHDTDYFSKRFYLGLFLFGVSN
jgi:hypothetical protein